MKRLCIVEDDPIIGEMLSLRLEAEGYNVQWFNEIERALDSNLNWDLYIVDILLNGKKLGYRLVEHIRSIQPRVPVLFLSALCETSERIYGLNLGADDFLTKPFEMEELLLRIKGMLKRQSWYQLLPQDQSYYQWDDNIVYFDAFQAQVNDHRIPLSEKECMLLKLLIEKKNEVVTRDEILDRVWGYCSYPTNRVVDNFLVKFRKVFGNKKKYFQTVRGVGYRFIPQGVDSE